MSLDSSEDVTRNTGKKIYGWGDKIEDCRTALISTATMGMG